MSARTPRPVQVTGLRVVYGDTVALHHLDLDLAPGSLVTVTGPSGAGKSSLLWAMAGALTPAAGSVSVGGSPVFDRRTAVQLGVAVVPQGNALSSALTARENVLVPLLAARVPPDEAADRAVRALAAVGLEDSTGHLVEELSGGQKQRVAVARALAARASVLLADEPTSDLDGGNRERVVACLRAEAEAGAAVLMSTHDPEASVLADAELALDAGGRRGLDRRPGAETVDAHCCACQFLAGLCRVNHIVRRCLDAFLGRCNRTARSPAHRVGSRRSSTASHRPRFRALPTPWDTFPNNGAVEPQDAAPRGAWSGPDHADGLLQQPLHNVPRAEVTALMGRLEEASTRD